MQFLSQSVVSPPFNIEIVEREDSVVLRVAGELDLSTARSLDDALARAKATESATIVVDLDSVGFIDSTGLHVLIKHALGDERVRLTKGSPQARRLFELTGTLDHFTFVSSD